MKKDILFQDEFRRKVLSGVDQLADTVKITIGPGGRNVILHRKAGVQGTSWSDRALPGASVISTNDGSTIAAAIVLEDPAENMGAQLIAEACAKTNDAAGDGTTTAAILAQEMIRSGFRLTAAGADPVELSRGIAIAGRIVKSELQRMAVSISTQEQIAQVASVSCQDPEIGRIIGEALFRIGPEGVITVDDVVSSFETTLDVQEGIVFEKGYLHPQMVTDPKKQIAELHNAFILITDHKIESSRDIIDLLIEVAEAESELLIIAEAVDTEPMGILLRNKAEADFLTIAVNPPMYGEGRDWRLEDLAIQTGGTFISSKLGKTLKETHRSDLGRAEYIKVSRRQTVIMGAKGDPQEIEERVKMLRHLAETTDYEFNRKRYKERLAKFVSGVAVITPGGRTELEVFEKRMRIEDAVNAARHAWSSGVLPGGGTAFIDAIPALDRFIGTLAGSVKFGAQIVRNAISKPLWQIAVNSGISGDRAVEQVAQAAPGIGLNAQTQKYEHMMNAGIMDPFLVTAMAFDTAISVSMTLLTAQAGVTDKS